MTAGRDYIDYLQDISDSIEKIGEFIQGMDFSEFEKDDRTLYAVIRAIEILGEATKKIPKEINSVSSIPARRSCA